LSEYTARDWQNGKYCPQHNLPYCTPCFKLVVAKSGENPYKEHQDFAQFRENTTERIKRILADGVLGFYRPKTTRNGTPPNFFINSRSKQFAASCQLGPENFLVIPIEFAIVGDDKTAYRADDDETRAILTKEHLWDISTPEWMQHDIPQLDDEDSVLLREFQLFKS
jgi:hypothetical protein